MTEEESAAFLKIAARLQTEEPRFERMGDLFPQGPVQRVIHTHSHVHRFSGWVYVAAGVLVFAAALAIMLIPVR